MEIIATLVIVFIILIGNEFWWRDRETHGEFSRKFVHITVGSFVAFWPFFLSWLQIELLSVAFLVVVLGSKYLKVFQAIHSVQRPTWGEVFFALSVGIVALITHDKWIYTAALLQMSLADGLAAIMGIRYGGKHRYNVFGYPKSIFGTATFLVVSIVILTLINSYATWPLSIAWMIGVSAVATAIENVGVRGLDNLLVPVTVALLLAYR